jgi:hypothetical protein
MDIGMANEAFPWAGSHLVCRSVVLSQTKGFEARFLMLGEVDGGFEFLGGAVDAATELTFGEQSEPAFHEVE